MAREKHEFQFKSADISKAAREEATYHEKRAEYWNGEMDRCFKIVEETAKVTIKKQYVTNGWRLDVDVAYGDMTAYRRLQEAATKVQSHQSAADAFRSDEKLYGTQGDRVYDLSTSDVHHFRLGGGQREE